MNDLVKILNIVFVLSIYSGKFKRVSLKNTAQLASGPTRDR